MKNKNMGEKIKEREKKSITEVIKNMDEKTELDDMIEKRRKAFELEKEKDELKIEINRKTKELKILKDENSYFSSKLEEAGKKFKEADAEANQWWEAYNILWEEEKKIDKFIVKTYKDLEVYDIKFDEKMFDNMINSEALEQLSKDVKEAFLRLSGLMDEKQKEE